MFLFLKFDDSGRRRRRRRRRHEVVSGGPGGRAPWENFVVFKVYLRRNTIVFGNVAHVLVVIFRDPLAYGEISHTF